VRSNTRGRERIAAVNSAPGEAVGGGAVGARHVRRRGREAAVGTPTRSPDSAFKARYNAGVWQPCGALTGGPGAGNGGWQVGPHVSDF
jgi:hypothetical protein